MIKDIFMPALSSTMTEGKIVSWVKSPGDKVEKGETVVVVESDKADMDVESFYEGYLATILVNAGEEAPVGATIALIAETVAEIEEAKKQASQSQPKTAVVATPTPTPTTAEPVVTVVTEVNTVAGNGRIVASPRARKLAQELGVDLGTLKGSGPHGRIVAEDVELAAGKTPQPATVIPVTSTAITPPVAVTPSTPVAIPTTPVNVALGETVALNTLQQAVVRNMTASLQVPTFQVGYTITTTALDQLYQQVKSKGVTMTALLAKAVALTLQKHPILNASYTDAGIQYHSNINVAVAVAMPGGGLITPVLKNANQIDVYSLARSWKDLVDRSRLKQLQPDEYNSGTFTLSNLGMFGVDRFSAILPPGQGSILAIGASRPQVVATPDGMFGVKNQMSVNITCDHRIIYGADAAAFLQDLAVLIETNAQALTM
jgi:pyruvate dehydrogenase E2 component (dihydrolipoamide acetyltransferase)